jgi:PKD repeat protein
MIECKSCLELQGNSSINKIIINNAHIPSPNAKHLGELENQQICTTWILKDNSQECISDITSYCNEYNLNVMKDGLFTLKVSGNTKDLSNALVAHLHKYTENDYIYYASNTSIQLPTKFSGVVDNILGINTKKIAHPYFHRSNIIVNNSLKEDTNVSLIEPHASTVFTPLQVATLYNYPTGLDGTGQKIGIIELGGGYLLSDMKQYLSDLGISGTPNITDVSVDGATNNPSDRSSSIEVVLDIQVIMALVPKASLFVYFASNTDQGFYDAISQAINTCNIVSISWGAPEAYWYSSTLTTFNNLFQYGTMTKNVTIFVASGDNGSSDGLTGNNVDFPASSPYSVGCGGTSLQTTNNTTISQEITWTGSGGGVSNVFAKPNYQSNVTFPLNNKRGVPDVSGSAEPNRGYILYSSIEGGNIVVGGTSAVSPLWSGLIAMLNQSLGHSIGFLQTILYNNNICRDIIQGTNGTYVASINWDPCTGWGSPNGQALLNLLQTTTPIASFTGTPLTGTSPLTVSFTSQSTGSPTTYLYNFGDSTTGSQANMTHTYTSAGTYTVTLTVSNTNGSNTQTRTNYITVTNPIILPVASFTGIPLTGTSPLTVSFTSQSTGSPTTYLYNFGDSTTGSQANMTHTYSSAGTYTVTLTVSNTNGSNTQTRTNYITVTNPPPIASFTGTPLTGTHPLTVSFTSQSTGSPTTYLYNFGDSTTGSQANMTHTYSSAGTYTVTLTVSNTNGSNTQTRTNYITVTNPIILPVASFTGTPLTGTHPLTVSFTSQSTGSPTIYLYNFGDSTTGSQANMTHTYTSVGTYTVTLTVSNINGSNTQTRTNYITVTNPPPVASFTGIPLTGTHPLTVSFTSQSTGSPTTYLYNFGDSTTGSQANMTHTYSSAGTYTVTLTVSNTNGSNTQTRTNYITVTNPIILPVASFTGTPLTGASPLTVSFTSQSTGSPTTYLYNFGDFTSGSQPNMTHVYSSVGTYTVTLTVSNTNGSNVQTKTNYITVTNPIVHPIIAFTATPLSGVVPLTVQFTDQSTNHPTKYTWSFGDSTTSSSKNPVHIYNRAGLFTVSLTTTSSQGLTTLRKISYIKVSFPH